MKRPTDDQLLTWFIYGWAGLLAVLVLFTSIAQFFRKPFLQAWGSIFSLLNPFNLGNLMLAVIALSPILAAYIIRASLRNKNRVE